MRSFEILDPLRRDSNSFTQESYRPDETGEDFVRKWPINNNNGLDAPQWLKEESGPKPVNVEKNMFPTDLVSYLRQIVAGIPASGKLGISKKRLTKVDYF